MGEFENLNEQETLLGETTLNDSEETFSEPEADSDNQEQASQAYWQAHENAKKGYWKNEQDVIKAYDYVNNRYKPLETVLGKRGIKDADGLTEIFKKYDEYLDPKSDMNLSYNGLKFINEHPEYGKQFQQLINEIAEKEEIAKYGLRLPQEVKEKLSKVEEFERRFKEEEQQKQTAEFESKLDENINSIQELCSSKGLELTQEGLQGFLNYCLENKIGINQIYDKFISMHLDDLLGSVQSKASQAVVKNLNKNSQASIASGSRVQVKEIQKIANRFDLSKAIGKSLGE